MASADEFKGAVKRLMHQSGSLDVVQAQVRAEILKAVYSEKLSESNRTAEPETNLLNELIREYLGFQGYAAAASVFVKDAQLNHDAVPRASLDAGSAVSCNEHESRLPLLYALLRRTRAVRPAAKVSG